MHIHINRGIVTVGAISSVLSGCVSCSTGYWSTAGNGGSPCIIPTTTLSLWYNQAYYQFISGRGYHASVLLKKNMLVMGGQISGSPNVAFNDVYKSSDDGGSWTLSTTAASWSKRWGLRAEVIGSDIIIAGGYDGSKYYNDVWKSNDGSTWILLSSTNLWAPRRGHLSIVIGTDLYLLGGGGAAGIIIFNYCNYLCDHNIIIHVCRYADIYIYIYMFYIY